MTYLKFGQFLCAKREKVTLVQNYIWISPAIHQSATLRKTQSSAFTKELSICDPKQQRITRIFGSAQSRQNRSTIVLVANRTIFPDAYQKRWNRGKSTVLSCFLIYLSYRIGRLFCFDLLFLFQKEEFSNTWR